MLQAASATRGSPRELAEGSALDAAAAREARQALAELCQQYWYPVYAFIRRRRGAELAHDLTQQFILQLIEGSSLQGVDPERGRFRSWLLGAVKHFLSNRARHEAAEKRNEAGNVSFDALLAERRYACEPRSELTPEHLYDRAFSLCVLERAVGRLGHEMAARGHGPRFEVIRRLLPGPDLEDGTHAPLAASLGISPNHFKKLVFDCRARFKVYLEAEIAELVGTPDPAATESAGADAVSEEREFLARALTLPPC